MIKKHTKIDYFGKGEFRYFEGVELADWLDTTLYSTALTIDRLRRKGALEQIHVKHPLGGRYLLRIKKSYVTN